MKKQSITATLKNSKGFTLIEMAIVLVIIGIILAAVMKGQDLIEGAKSKQFATKIQTWQVALSTYYDRKGRFPGDTNKNGVIADTGDTAATPSQDIASASFASAPEESFMLGGTKFVVKIGNDGQTVPKNYLVVCKDDTCNATYDPADANDLVALKFFESFDTSTDGTADANTGTVKGFTGAVGEAGAKVTTVTGPPTSSDWLGNSGTKIDAFAIHLK